MSLEEVQRVEWAVLDKKIKNWIQALKVVIQGLLVEERRICSQIFTANTYAVEECFTKAGKGCVLQLLSFADAIAFQERSCEKIFRVLDMYEALAELLPELVALFSGEARGFIKEEAERTLVRLGDAVRVTVAEFAKKICMVTSRRLLPGGQIHPLTRYVMNYVRFLPDYSHSLNYLLDGCDTEMEDVDMTPLGHCVMTLITHLLDKIEDRSKIYDDEALQNIFLMNNVMHIVQKVKGSELKTFLGDNWIRMRRGQIRTYYKGYLQASWTRVLACLTDDGLPRTAGKREGAGKCEGAPKERLMNFNLAYEKLYRTQTTWMVLDPQLREKLRISISEKLIPAYGSFVGRYQGPREGLREFKKYVKYSPEDLENQILDFFAG
jgi:exocyst complex protein 7